MDLYRRNLSLLGACGSVKPKDLETVMSSLAKGRYSAADR